MATTPGYSEDLSREVVAVYSSAERVLLEKLASGVAKGLGENEYELLQLAAIREYERQASETLKDLAKRTTEETHAATAAAAQRGAQDALRELTDQLGESVQDALPVDSATVAEMASAYAGKLSATHFQIYRETTDAYRRIIGEAMRAPALGVETRAQAAQRALNEFASGGITAYRDSRGRRWSMSSYTEMAGRSTMMNSHLAGHEHALKKRGLSLIVVSNHSQECKMCRPWEGKVLSLDDNDRPGEREQPSELTGEPVKFRVEGTLSEAKRAGLFHPNCRHSFSTFTAGLTDLDFGETSDPEGDKARQKLRKLERDTRELKRAQAVALDENDHKAIGRRIREKQAAIRDHVASHDGLKRQRQRERITGEFGDGVANKQTTIEGPLDKDGVDSPKLEELQNKYRRATDDSEKRKLRAEIRKEKQALQKQQPVDPSPKPPTPEPKPQPVDPVDQKRQKLQDEVNYLRNRANDENLSAFKRSAALTQLKQKEAELAELDKPAPTPKPVIDDPTKRREGESQEDYTKRRRRERAAERKARAQEGAGTAKKKAVRPKDEKEAPPAPEPVTKDFLSPEKRAKVDEWLKKIEDEPDVHEKIRLRTRFGVWQSTNLTPFDHQNIERPGSVVFEATRANIDAKLPELEAKLKGRSKVKLAQQEKLREAQAFLESSQPGEMAHDAALHNIRRLMDKHGVVTVAATKDDPLPRLTRLYMPESSRESRARTNPNYGTKPTYGVNCQRVVQNYELRRRGYDAQARPRDTPLENHEIQAMWVRSSGAKAPVYELDVGKGGDLHGVAEMKMLEETKPGEETRWFMSGCWKRGSAHIWNVVAKKDADGIGRVFIEEAQTNRTYPLAEYTGRLATVPNPKKGTWLPRLQRVDNLTPLDIITEVTEDRTIADKYKLAHEVRMNAQRQGISRSFDGSEKITG